MSFIKTPMYISCILLCGFLDVSAQDVSEGGVNVIKDIESLLESFQATTAYVSDRMADAHLAEALVWYGRYRMTADRDHAQEALTHAYRAHRASPSRRDVRLLLARSSLALSQTQIAYPLLRALNEESVSPEVTLYLGRTMERASGIVSHESIDGSSRVEVRPDGMPGDPPTDQERQQMLEQSCDLIVSAADADPGHRRAQYYAARAIWLRSQRREGADSRRHLAEAMRRYQLAMDAEPLGRMNFRHNTHSAWRLVQAGRRSDSAVGMMKLCRDVMTLVGQEWRQDQAPVVPLTARMPFLLPIIEEALAGMVMNGVEMDIYPFGVMARPGSGIVQNKWAETAAAIAEAVKVVNLNGDIHVVLEDGIIYLVPDPALTELAPFRHVLSMDPLKARSNALTRQKMREEQGGEPPSDRERWRQSISQAVAQLDPGCEVEFSAEITTTFGYFDVATFTIAKGQRTMADMASIATSVAGPDQTWSLMGTLGDENIQIRIARWRP